MLLLFHAIIPIIMGLHMLFLFHAIIPCMGMAKKSVKKRSVFQHLDTCGALETCYFQLSQVRRMY